MAFAVVATAKNVGSVNPNCLRFKGIMKSFSKRITEDIQRARTMIDSAPIDETSLSLSSSTRSSEIIS